MRRKTGYIPESIWYDPDKHAFLAYYVDLWYNIYWRSLQRTNITVFNSSHLCRGCRHHIIFSDTDITNGDVWKLAAVEATQSGSVIFTLLGEILVFHGKFPEGLSLIGMILIISGMIFHSITS